ncbi:putative modifying wall lignin-1/2 [Helianthus annuus]|nr:putative modifying wall lignin-1/2 [Helianthus annuus]
MENKEVGFCAIVAVLGIISASSGFAAEFTRVKADDVSIDDDSCVYPSSPALALGIISAVFAIITQIYISITFGACRCCGNDPNSTPISKLLSVLSWVATVIAVVLLLTAAGLNNKEGGEVDSYGYFTCYVVKPGIFAAGAVLALLSAVFGIAAYVTVAPPTIQTITNPAVAFLVGANVDPEKSPMPFLPQQYPPQQYSPQQYHPQQTPQQYPPQQYA